MKHIVILTPSFLDEKTGELKIGGLESYLYNLSQICNNAGYDVLVCQLSSVDKPVSVIKDGIHCRIVPTIKNQKTFDAVYDELNDGDTLFIIGTDQMDVKSKAENVILIQHGIAFDIPGSMISGFWGKTVWLQTINKFLRCIKNSRRAGYAGKIVCVDYNFYNWFKTIGAVGKTSMMKVIPNYSNDFITREELAEKLSRTDDVVRIIFARRFCDYRGTLLMADAAEIILKHYSGVKFTFAGDGPLKLELERRFMGNPDVTITSFKSDQSVNVHKQYDIAVVPTIYSEGTSLSLCEAMAAGCVPIASHVGGMTNMILNEFNGFLINPVLDELVDCIRNVLALDRERRNAIAHNAYESAVLSFSRDRWEKQWLKFIDLCW